MLITTIINLFGASIFGRSAPKTKRRFKTYFLRALVGPKVGLVSFHLQNTMKS